MGSRRLEVAAGGHGSDLLQYFAMCGVWALSTYTACDIRCSYCITYAQGASEPRVPVGEVADRLAAELAHLPPHAVIGVGALVDAYPSVEAATGATREALGVLAADGRRVVVVTKGTAVARDADLLAALPQANVHVSLCSHDDDALRHLEPHAPSAADRLAAVRALAAAGVDVQLHVQPWIPGTTDVAALAARAGAGVPVHVAPLSVASPAVARTRLGRRFTQAEVDDAYRREVARLANLADVTWQQPLWQTPPGWRAPYEKRDDAGVTVEARNLATVHRLLAALRAGAGLQVWFDVCSPYLRCHDVQGLSLQREHPRSGFFREVLFEVARALETPSYDVDHLEAEGDVVRGRIVCRGRHVRPLFHRRPSQRALEVVADLTYRFDHLGLVVELTQDVAVAEPGSTELGGTDPGHGRGMVGAGVTAPTRGEGPRHG